MTRNTDSKHQSALDSECQIIYQYLRQHTALSSPPETVKEFQNLFLPATERDRQISQALEKIFASDKQYFHGFLSHCCYSVLDCWADSSDTTLPVSQLLDTFTAFAQTQTYDRRRKHLARTIADYQQTEPYLQLKAVAAIIEPQTPAKLDSANLANNGTYSKSDRHSQTTLSNYISRYTYLYQHFLPHDSPPHLTRFIQQLQEQRQRDFEIQLSKHIIYRFRLKQLAQMKLLSKGAGKMITKVDNPSLLSERAFKVAWQQYLKKTENHTMLERSQRFVAENKFRSSCSEFKQDLYSFLTYNIKPKNSAYQFNRQLKQKLAEIFPQSDAKPLNKSLILQTCRQLISFLIVDSSQPNSKARFAELTANLGTAVAADILVKIVLICPESKIDLAKKIGAIVIHSQLEKAHDLPWLIKVLEHLSIAFSVYFGNFDLSLAKLSK